MIRLLKKISSYQGSARSHEEKWTENFVERISKIYRELIKYEIHNITTGPMIFQHFRNFEKWSFLLFFENFIFISFSLFFAILIFWRGALRVLRAETRLTVYRTMYSTETVAKPARLGPAQNSKPRQNFIELARFWFMMWRKVPGIRCRAYVED